MKVETQIQLAIQTRLAPISGVDSKARTANLVWSSGGRVKRYDWERDRLKGPLTLYARKAHASGQDRVRAFDAGLRYWVDGPTEEPEWGVRVGFIWAF